MITTNNGVLRPAEWVLPGHPDKLADAVADALVWQAQVRQPEALCSIEVAIYRDAVYLTGRLACQRSGDIDIAAVVRDVYRTAGYGGGWLPAPDALRISGNLCIDELVPGEEAIRHLSDDQSIVIGYAIDLPSTGFIAPEQWLARELARELYQLVDSPLNLCPDGKVLVILEEGNGKSRLHTVSASLLAPEEVGGIELQRAAVRCLQKTLARAGQCLPGFDPVLPEQLIVNGGGNFLMGGPEADNGLSGKKLLLDYYGPRVVTGGAALSGKDFHKPDRAAALIARRLALAVVRTGIAVEATVQLVTCPGDEAPTILRIATPDGDLAKPERWNVLIDCRRFDAASGWGRFVDAAELARWGHFGHRAYPWERLPGEDMPPVEAESSCRPVTPGMQKA